VTAKLDEKQYCQYWILGLVVVIRFRAYRDRFLKLYMLVKSAKQFLVSFTAQNMSTLGLLHMVS